MTTLLNYDGPVATLTLNRPEKRNALSSQFIEDIAEALDHVKKSAAQVLILTGTGTAFCAGMDLEELRNMLDRSEEENLRHSERMAAFFRSIWDFPKPSIAAVNGPAIAGGTGIATMCDFTLAVPEARFGYTEVRLGFVPAIVASILVLQVGHKVARDLLLTGRFFDATEAYRLGLVNEVVPADTLLPRARELADVLVANSPASLQATKMLLNGFLRDSLDQQMDRAIQCNAEIRRTRDFREGITAFLEKRKPNWGGRKS